jgi:hypothetical protein
VTFSELTSTLENVFEEASFYHLLETLRGYAWLRLRSPGIANSFYHHTKTLKEKSNLHIFGSFKFCKTVGSSRSDRQFADSQSRIHGQLVLQSGRLLASAATR